MIGRDVLLIHFLEYSLFVRFLLGLILPELNSCHFCNWFYFLCFFFLSFYIAADNWPQTDSVAKHQEFNSRVNYFRTVWQQINHQPDKNMDVKMSRRGPRSVCSDRERDRTSAAATCCSLTSWKWTHSLHCAVLTNLWITFCHYQVYIRHSYHHIVCWTVKTTAGLIRRDVRPYFKVKKHVFLNV